MPILHQMPVGAIDYARLPKYRIERPLNIPYMTKGSSIYQVRDLMVGDPIEAFEHIAIVKSGQLKPMKDLREMAGSVNITSSKEALDYVRLRTSLTTWYLWSGPIMLEIMSRQNATKMANYGLTSWRQPVWSGCMGVLLEPLMKKSGIAAASVTFDQHTYHIRRSVLSETSNYHPIILQIEETVESDGRYSRRIIKQTPAISKPHINWYIMKSE